MGECKHERLFRNYYNRDKVEKYRCILKVGHAGSHVSDDGIKMIWGSTCEDKCCIGGNDGR